MKDYSALLATELNTLPFSTDCKQWFRDARVHTVEDTEEHITRLVQSSYYTKDLLNEMRTVIIAHMAQENDHNAVTQQMNDKQQHITNNNNIIKYLTRLIRTTNNI